jgi:subtilisin family serine protease
MTNITLSIDEEVYKKMRRYSEIKWSEFVRKCVQKRVEELLEECHKNNIITVCATGNRADKPVMYPANYPFSIGVTSYKKGRLISDFSPSGDNIDFALPGDKIITTGLNDTFSVVSGSSFAAPFMSGIIALLLSSYKKRNISYTPDTILDKLKTKCIKIDTNDKHAQFGYGLLDLKTLH